MTKVTIADINRQYNELIKSFDLNRGQLT